MEHRLPGRAGRPGRSPLPGNPGGVRPGPAGNKKSIYAVTTDGRLAQIWDTTKWNLSFPAELANAGSLRFQV